MQIQFNHRYFMTSKPVGVHLYSLPFRTSSLTQTTRFLLFKSPRALETCEVLRSVSRPISEGILSSMQIDSRVLILCCETLTNPTKQNKSFLFMD
ncbi:hypothetical protein [Methanobrevibacter sp.]|uniref:hypothetical protein n=1 Tax=Methanobrevibacter sp. TaxID=66852 RepID=UPI0025CEDCD6|nr:hypothetical protein [Methanobrevibacter sp.]MBR4447933.1 hypothetical protein [Methanobrevibacter sp.]